MVISLPPPWSPDHQPFESYRRLEPLPHSSSSRNQLMIKQWVRIPATLHEFRLIICDHSRVLHECRHQIVMSRHRLVRWCSKWRLLVHGTVRYHITLTTLIIQFARGSSSASSVNCTRTDWVFTCTIHGWLQCVKLIWWWRWCWWQLRGLVFRLRNFASKFVSQEVLQLVWMSRCSGNLTH